MSAPAASTGTPAAAPVLRIEGLRKEYGRHVVLSDVDLSVSAHQVVALIGASGSGKSTLLRCVDLLEQVDDGLILLDGEDITDPRVNADRVRQRIGMVFQAFNLFPHLSVLDNVTLAPRKVHGTGRRQAQAEAMVLLERFGLADKAADYPDRLSGGQQQRAAIIRCLATRPRLLLLDEVTSALDPELVTEVLELIGELKSEGLTMLLATHEMSFARSVADQVCFLDAGTVVERGDPEQIFEQPRQQRTKEFLQRIQQAGRLP